jgi:hypothetical protein
MSCEAEQVEVRFESKADICSAKSHVRFTPDSDRESGRTAGPGLHSALLGRSQLPRRVLICSSRHSDRVVQFSFRFVPQCRPHDFQH